MSATDPLATLWAALERSNCEPHGQPWNFRARCPLHGDNPGALHVTEGADRRAVLHCFARGCDSAQVAAAVGLTMPDLFAAGQRHARRVPVEPVRRSDLEGGAREVANVLAGLDLLGVDWADEHRDAVRVLRV